MDKHSHIGNQEIASIDELYQDYIKDPESVELSWRHFFRGFELARTSYLAPNTTYDESINKEFAVINLINAYRQRGHLFTKTNPVRTRRTYTPTLDISNFELEPTDLDCEFSAGARIGIGKAKLSAIIAHLEETYCYSVGVEYMYVRQPEMVKWLQDRMESTKNTQLFSDDEHKDIFNHLKRAVGFESFIHKKFVGQKRFSLEGGENLIPALNHIIEHGSKLGIEEFTIAMAHRGRLNVLGNIMQKPYSEIFKEFYGTEYEADISMGDVKYHLGFENTITTSKNKLVKLCLLPNPSHLETVSGIIQGLSRSKIDFDYDGNFSKLAPIVIHGDAAIAAQGVVYETVQMSQLKGYKTGGTIHLVINNQVGFTTNYLDARSSTYCTDVAKVTRCPVFHVNGDDVEALIYTIKLAMEYRQEFSSDVFIDILCYRKYGHNEGDEPRFTQPLLYDAIAKHPNPRDIYKDKLISKGILTNEVCFNQIKEFDDFLENQYCKSQEIEKLKIRNFLLKEYEPYERPAVTDFDELIDTTVSLQTLRHLGDRLTSLPENKSFFQKVQRIISDRKEMLANNQIDWALGELLAYASLVNEGHAVRLSGQDCERGTFAHRHAAFVVEDMDDKYFPLKNISPNQAPFHAYNSLLSEYGVLGFEYGYALANPNGLNIWEAQFGDFANTAQVIFDQYISSAEEKWGVMNNLVLYLPHGYEGQGPEHSSARIERYLALASNSNMQIAIPSTPANLFHLLRRHLLLKTRVPLVIFTPKSLLRHPLVNSRLDELSNDHFRAIIDDSEATPSEIKEVVLTSGRLYYDLLKTKNEKQRHDIAIVRIEQLYPIPKGQLREIRAKYAQAKRWIWAQDEPENMGAWTFISRKLPLLNLELVSRPESGTPAGGLMHTHMKRLNDIINAIFNLN
ncbi:MAG: 2-oxoglutarate dehydrogenase E1 component [Mangrovibacterium sp.]